MIYAIIFEILRKINSSNPSFSQFTPAVPNQRDQFRLNVGFLINQVVGFSRIFDFDVPNFRLEADINLRQLSGAVELTRTAQGILVQATMEATLMAECVRCLADFQQHLAVEFTELYAFSRQSVTDSELIVPENAQIDLAPLVREYVLLELPISPLCRVDCLGLCPVCGENRNDVLCSHEEEDTDPRLNILKSLLDTE